MLKKLTSIFILITLYGCQGDFSHKTPIHPNPNMDNQKRYNPQAESTFFEDGRAMRIPPAGTVSRGNLKEDSYFHTGMINNFHGDKLPIPLTRELLERGKNRFNIYCSMCHGAAGFGDGIIVNRGIIPPPSFHDQRLLALPIGHFFHVMTYGIRTMPSYAVQIPPEDRWAIAAYIRALQLSQRGRLNQIPEDIRASKGWGGFR